MGWRINVVMDSEECKWRKKWLIKIGDGDVEEWTSCNEPSNKDKGCTTEDNCPLRVKGER